MFDVIDSTKDLMRVVDRVSAENIEKFEGMPAQLDSRKESLKSLEQVLASTAWIVGENMGQVR